jgi:ABC-type multidrug transport system permease subunit
MTYCTLLERDVKEVMRHPMMIKSRFFQTVFLSIYLGGIYCRFGADYTNTITWQTVTGFLFFLSISSVFMSFTPATLVFLQQRSVILKEESGKLYTVWPYFLSRNTVEIPYGLIFPALQALIIYWFVGLSSTPGQFFTFYLIMLLMNFNGMSAGLLVGSMLDDAKSVAVLSPIIMQPFIVFSGFFRNKNGMPGWISWIQYLSPFKFGFAAFTENEVMNRESNVEQLNFDTDLWVSILCLAGLGVGYRLLSFFILWKMKTKVEG